MREWFPIFAQVDLLTDPRPWFSELRAMYDDLRLRRRATAAIYKAMLTS